MRPTQQPQNAPAEQRIVLVEDFADLAELTRDVLEFEGFSVFVAATGEEAVELCAKVQPGLVLLDAHVPGLHGQALVDTLRRQPGTRNVVAVTGAREPLTDVCETLVKPFDIQTLIGVVRRYLPVARPSRAVNFADVPL